MTAAIRAHQDTAYFQEMIVLARCSLAFLQRETRMLLLLATMVKAFPYQVIFCIISLVMFQGSGYDLHPVLLEIITRYGEPRVVRNGLRINQITINRMYFVLSHHKRSIQTIL